MTGDRAGSPTASRARALDDGQHGDRSSCANVVRQRAIRRAQPEKHEQAQIVRLLRTLSAHLWVTGVPRRRGDFQGAMRTPGLPDVFAFVPVRQRCVQTWHFVAIEVKAHGGRLRPEQATFQACCRLAGVAHVVGGLDAVMAWLVSIGALRADGVPHYRRGAMTAGADTDGAGESR